MRLLIALCLAFCLTAPAHAVYVQTAKVRYQSGYSMSDWYTVEVRFLTGQELNRATSSFGYGYGRYAVIFWGPGEASVIKFDGVLYCGLEFTQSCLSSFGNTKGVDQSGRSWEICTSIYCF